MIRIVVALLIFAPQVLLAADGALFLSPARATYEVGDIFEVRIYADTDGEPVGAAEAELRYNPDQFRIDSVSTENSILSTWATEPWYSNGLGELRLSGWVGGSPYTGSRGEIITIAFQALEAGADDIAIVSGSLLSTREMSSNIITNVRSAMYRVEPQRIAQDEFVEEGADSSPEVAGASISPPSIASYTRTLRPQERLVVEGYAPENSPLVLVYARGDETPVRVALLSTADGRYTFASDAGLDPGTYRVWVELNQAQGLKSEIVSVVVSGVAAQFSLVGTARAYAPYVIVFLFAFPALLLFYKRGKRQEEEKDI